MGSHGNLSLLASGDELVDFLKHWSHLLGNLSVGLNGFGNFVNDGLDDLLSQNVGLFLVALHLWRSGLAGNV
jgi:hypothetical protein